MNKILSCIALLAVCGLGVHGQDANKYVDGISLTKTTGDILNILKAELDSRKLTYSLPSDIKGVLNSEEGRKQYFAALQKQFQQAYSQVAKQDISFSLNTDLLSSYGHEALTRFKTVSGGRNVDELMRPILGSSLVHYATLAVQQYYATKKQEIEVLVNDALSLLKKKGIDYSKQTIAQVKASIQQLLQQRLNPDSLNDVLIDQVNAYAARMIAANTVKIDVSSIESRFKQNFTTAHSIVKSVCKKSLTDLGNSITTLSKNEEVVNHAIEGFQDEINKGAVKLSQIETRIRALVSIPNSAEELKKLQIEHAQVIAQNYLQTSVISQYLQRGVEVIGNLENYKQTATQLFTGQYLTEFKKKLEVFKIPTLSGVVNFSVNTLDNVADIGSALSSVGILNKEAAKKVATFVKGAKIALSLATSLIPPNPIGIIGALGSLGGLFGGGGPTIEEQMFDAMQKGFDKINERLDTIEAKIDRLTDYVQNMRKDIMKSMQLLSADLKALLENTKLISQMNGYTIYASYNLVEVMIRARPKNGTGLKLYADWWNTSPTNNALALTKMDEFISSSDNLRQVISGDFTNVTLPESYVQLAVKELEAYNTTKALFYVNFPEANSNNKEKNLLLVPAAHCQFDMVLTGEEIVPDINTFDLTIATDKYINNIFLNKLINQYITLQPFFLLIKRGMSNYQPMDNLEEAIANYETILLKVSSVKDRLDNLLHFVNYGIAQQSMLAGHVLLPSINMALFGDGSLYNASIETLQKNELLRKNFCTYLINAKIELEDRNKAIDLINKARLTRGNLDSLNALIKYGASKLKFSFAASDPADANLYLNYCRQAGEPVVAMPVPDISVLGNQEMIYSDHLYALLISKQKVMDALMDIAFFDELSPAQTATYKNVFFSTSK